MEILNKTKLPALLRESHYQLPFNELCLPSYRDFFALPEKLICVINGSAGIGKSSLMYIAFNQLFENNSAAIWVHSERLVPTIYGVNKNNDGPSLDLLFELLANINYLFIDDGFFIEEWPIATSFMRKVFLHRHRLTKKTIFTSLSLQNSYLINDYDALTSIEIGIPSNYEKLQILQAAQDRNWQHSSPCKLRCFLNKKQLWLIAKQSKNLRELEGRFNHARHLASD